MILKPRNPPGRTTRRARAFQQEMALLYEQGYTCDAIREALADAGVIVSKSTVQREIARHAASGMSIDARPTDATGATAAPASTVASPRNGRPRNGRDIAEAFFHNRITNPLARERSSDEGSSH